MKKELLYSQKGNVLYGPLLLKPSIFRDKRGYFLESWNQNVFNKSVGKKISSFENKILFI